MKVEAKQKNLSCLQAAYHSGLGLYELWQENHWLRSQLHRSEMAVETLLDEVNRLKEQLKLAQSRHFGKKRDSGDLPLVPALSMDLTLDTTNPTITVCAHSRKKGPKSGRLIDLSSLPSFQIHHDLDDKTCYSCHQALRMMGTETSEQLEMLPQRFYRAEHIRYKYSCSHCQTIQMGHKEPSPLPKALAGGSVLTEIAINKYQYHLPLYRQSKMMASIGLVIPDNTLGNWVRQLGEALQPLYQAFWKAISESRYLQVDETPVKILKPEKQGYLWGYHSPWIGKGGLVVFELSLTRSGETVQQRLASYKGLLQTDGYAGYEALRKREGITGLACLTHARRKFSEILKITKDTTGIAAQVIDRLKPLYALERNMREKQYSFHMRKRLRQKIAWPILKAFHKWLKKSRLSVLPKSQLGNAIQYTLKQWPYLIQYLRHGIAEIDTNWIEGEIRGFALGRKNWLFIGHECSGKIHAFFYSLISSAILNGINPRLYLHYVHESS
ncbi:MAG: IS66 family transposase [Gammaproteobacteria bacterium]